MRENRLPPPERLDPLQLQIAYYERADKSGRFYLLIGIPGRAPSIAAAGLRSGAERAGIYGGCLVYVKETLAATGRAFADEVRSIDDRYRMIGARSLSPRSGAVAVAGKLPVAFDPTSGVGRENLAVVWELGRRLAARHPAERLQGNGIPDLSDLAPVRLPAPVLGGAGVDESTDAEIGGITPLDLIEPTTRGESGVVADLIADAHTGATETVADAGSSDTASARPRVLARGKAVDELISRLVIEMLEKGVVPWRKPWSARGGPRNISGRPYRGINLFLLAMTPFSSPYWMTFRQAQERGGSVKPGERATPIVFYDRWEKKGTNARTGEEEIKRIPLIRTYAVFNLEQTEGVTPPPPPPGQEENEAAKVPIDAAEAIVVGMPNAPKITHGGAVAAYSPTRDSIAMPERGSFTGAEEYYSTLFHELGHSTGHASRVGRPGVETFDHFGSDRYGREELVAEMSSALLCAESGISPAIIENQVAYLANWIKGIKGDARLLVTAAADAQRAVDYVLARPAPGEPSRS